MFDITGKLIDLREYEGRVDHIQIQVDSNLKGLYLLRTSLVSGQVQTKKVLFK